MVPASVLQRPISGLRVPSGPPPVDGAEAPTREASVTETIQMALAWRVARQAIGLEDMGPMLPGCTSSSAVTPSVSAVPAALAATVGGVVPVGATPTQKVVKMSNVIDQTDDTVIATKTRAEMGIHYENHREVTGSEPRSARIRTYYGLTGGSHIEDKVIFRDESPYADFSILTPFGRRIQNVMKTKSFAFQPDGSWRAAEVPGPPSFQAWQACRRVYRSFLFMLRYPQTVSPAGGAPAPVSTGFKFCDRTASGGSAPCIGAILRVLQGAMPRVPRMLASSYAGGRSSERREVRTFEKEPHQGTCSRKTSSRRPVRPSDAVGWSFPSCSTGLPVLGRQCEKAGGCIFGQDGTPSTYHSRTNVRGCKSVCGQRGVGVGGKAQCGCPSREQEKEKKERPSGSRLFGRRRSRQEGQENDEC